MSADFPVTVETSYGSVTVDAEPERIVAFGSDYLDMLVSLDEHPVGFVDGGLVIFGAGAPLTTLLPWLAGDVDDDVLDADLVEGGDPNLEAVASYEPDLIVGAFDDDVAEEMSAIAPVYSGLPNDHEWEPDMRDVAAVTGHSDDVDQILDEVEQAFDDARDRLVGLQGKTYNIATLIGGEMQMGSFRVLADLGMVPAESQPTEGFPDISLENLDQLDGDVLVLIDFDETTAAFDADPRVDDLPAVLNDSMVRMPADFYGAISRSGPANRVWVVNELTPLLEHTGLNQEGAV